MSNLFPINWGESINWNLLDESESLSPNFMILSRFYMYIS
jgi:hypothetical protein